MVVAEPLDLDEADIAPRSNVVGPDANDHWHSAKCTSGGSTEQQPVTPSNTSVLLQLTEACSIVNASHDGPEAVSATFEFWQPSSQLSKPLFTQP